MAKTTSATSVDTIQRNALELLSIGAFSQPLVGLLQVVHAADLNKRHVCVSD